MSTSFSCLRYFYVYVICMSTPYVLSWVWMWQPKKLLKATKVCWVFNLISLRYIIILFSFLQYAEYISRRANLDFTQVQFGVKSFSYRRGSVFLKLLKVYIFRMGGKAYIKTGFQKVKFIAPVEFFVVLCWALKQNMKSSQDKEKFRLRAKWVEISRKGELDPKIKFVLFKRTLTSKITE